MILDIPEPGRHANMMIQVLRGDIRTFKTEALAAVITPDLAIEGRLNRAIFEKAGADLDSYILENIIEPKEGDVFVAPGFHLPAQHIIFSVVPYWRSDLDIVDRHLLNAVSGIVKKALEIKINKLCIPMLLCGKKKYPPERGVRLILQAASEAAGQPLEHIVFICESNESIDIYKSRLLA